MSSMRTKTHVADIVGDNVFCEKIADKKVNLSCRLLCSLHCCLQGKPLSFMWIFSIFHIIIRAEMVPKKWRTFLLLLWSETQFLKTQEMLETMNHGCGPILVHNCTIFLFLLEVGNMDD